MPKDGPFVNDSKFDFLQPSGLEGCYSGDCVNITRAPQENRIVCACKTRNLQSRLQMNQLKGPIKS